MMRGMRHVLAAILVPSLSLPLFVAPTVALAETYEVRSGDDLWGRLATLEPGDTVIVHEGTYTQTGRFEATWAGTASAPIVVEAAPGARPVLTRDGNQNLMNLHGSFFTMSGLELTGGSHALRLSNVSDATFERLLIHDSDDVGISCNIAGSTCARLTIRDNEIHHTDGTGEGMYLGCNDAACVVSGCVVERNFLHDLGGSQGDGIEIKQGSHSNVVRDNVIVGTRYPGITLYSFAPSAGAVANVIERNVVWTTEDNGIQVTGRAIVRNNIVVGAGASGIASIANQDQPTEVVIVHNTVVDAGDSCVRANAWESGAGFIVANNALYCASTRAMRLTGTPMVAGNVVLGTVEGATSGFVMGVSATADLGPASAMAVVYPPSGSSLLDVADPAFSTVERAGLGDFNGTPRGASPDVGAYERTTDTNPGWSVNAMMRPPLTSAGADAGVGVDAAIDDGGASDAATGLADAASVTVDGASIDGGASGADAGPASSSDGCSCRAGAQGRPPATLGLALAALAVMAARRRRG